MLMPIISMGRTLVAARLSLVLESLSIKAMRIASGSKMKRND